MTLPPPAQIILLALAASGSSDLDDVELARRIKQGDHEAFRAFFEAHHEALFRFLMSKGIEEATAEDLIQQAFILIWEKRDGIEPDRSLRAYLFRIAYTRMLNHIRDHSKFDTGEAVPQSKTRQTPEDYAQHGELTEAVENAIDSMPEKRRMVFEFCFMQEFTYRETAETLEISVKTVENHMGLALKDIRSALKEFRDI